MNLDNIFTYLQNEIKLKLHRNSNTYEYGDDYDNDDDDSIETTDETTLLINSQNQCSTPCILTHQSYLNIRQQEINNKPSFFNYLNFTKKTYFQHFKTNMYNSWLCLKSTLYFFIQAWYPDVFQHYAPDIIIDLGENILDEYSKSINHQANSI